MTKTEVYSWRLSLATKLALEETARQQQASVSELLEQIVGDWLARQEKSEADEAEQRRLHTLALKTIGTIRGDDPDRASNASALLRTKLARRREN